MSLVPALAEAHAARIERLKRMGSYRPNVVPYEAVRRPVLIEPEPQKEAPPEPVDLPAFLPPRRMEWSVLVSAGALKPCDARIILRHTSAKTHISVIDLQSERRTVKIMIPRMIACWVMREYTTMSLPQIGRHLGGRDHTTILHSVRRIEALRETDPEIRKLSDEIAEAACKEMQG